MQNILFLDDDPKRAALAYSRWLPEKSSRVVWCQTAEEAIKTLQEFDLEEIYLDHDLEGRMFVDSSHYNTGMEVVRFLEHFKNLEKFAETKFIIHSHNIRAGQQMYFRLKKLGFNIHYIPFGCNEIIIL